MYIGQMALVTISLFTFLILIVGSSSISQVFGYENTNWTIGESQWVDYKVSDKEPARIVVVDPDQNTNPNKTDYVQVHIFSDTDAAGIIMQLKESPTPNSGKFIGDVFFTATLKSEGDTLRITKGDTVSAVYIDKTLPRPYDVGDILNIYSSAHVENAEEFFPGMAIVLDQKVYSWTDKVYFTVVSLGHNKDPYQKDIIGDSAGELVEISTKFGKLSGYKLIETGENTSFFTGEVILTGDPFHDADGDGLLNGASGKTSGTGPTGGFIKSTSDDGISVAVQINQDKFWYGDALIRWNVGEIQFVNRDYLDLQNLIIRAIDPDMNLNPELVDTIDVKVSSDSDKKGTTITLSETSYATGIFEGIVFPTTGNSGGKYIHASKGEYVYAYYNDHTLPSPYTPADYLTISGSQKVTNLVSSQIEPKPSPIPSQPVASPTPVKTNTVTPQPVAPIQSPTQTISAASSLPSKNDSAPSIRNKIHTISAFGTSSDDVPLLGQIRVDLNFDMDFEVQTPTLISAGKSAEIIISPKTGTLTTTFYLNGNYIYAISKNVNFGHVEQIVVPTAQITVVNVLEFFCYPISYILS